MDTGESITFVYTVQNDDLADRVSVDSGDVFPPVLATSRVIGLMEIAAARLMRPLLKEGELSVGVGIEITHFAPTPVTEEVQCSATFEKMDGKLYAFTVELCDRGGKVASGRHTRAIVIGEKIVKIAEKRMAEAAAQ